METGNVDISVTGVDISDVENSVDNVEKPFISGKIPVENSVEKVDKKLHRGCQNNFMSGRPGWFGKVSFAGAACGLPWDQTRLQTARAAWTPEAPAWARPRVTPAPSPAAKKLGMAVSSSWVSRRRAE